MGRLIRIFQGLPASTWRPTWSLRGAAAGIIVLGGRQAVLQLLQVGRDLDRFQQRAIRRSRFTHAGGEVVELLLNCATVQDLPDCGPAGGVEHQDLLDEARYAGRTDCGQWRVLVPQDLRSL